MLRQLTLGAAVLATASAATAQQDTHRAHQITSAIKDAGVYHVATDSWTRGTGSNANFGPDTIYNNNAPSGSYGGFYAFEEWTLDGRAPSSAGHSGATADSYTIDGFQIGYCVTQASGSYDLNYTFYDLYTACTDPAVLSPLSSITLTGLPGSAGGATACWLVTIDLEGSTLAFTLSGDGDQIFDGITSLDNFGYRMIATTITGAFGPILSGDPTNFPMGDGTYYQNPGLSGTGLDAQDQFWLTDPSGAFANGCYWFGGYVNGAPYTALHLQLYGEAGGSAGCAEYCTSNTNSTGSAAAITVDTGCGTDTIGVTAAPVPDQPGIFFTGTTQLNVPFGNGVLCTGGSITRNGVVVASGNTVSDTISRPGYVPGGENAQYWYRDPAGGGAFFNTSSARVMD